MIVRALELGVQIAERLLELVLRVRPDDKRSVHDLTKPLNRIGGSGAKHLRVRFNGQELRERQVLLLKSQPANGLPQVAVLNLILGMSRKFHGRRPALFDAEFRQERAPAWFEHTPQLRDESKRT